MNPRLSAGMTEFPFVTMAGALPVLFAGSNIRYRFESREDEAFILTTFGPGCGSILADGINDYAWMGRVWPSKSAPSWTDFRFL
jgi:hypothetical protein